MDGTDSNSLPKRLCVGRVVDRISGLPDEIILVILSLLPLREAAAATVLSSRWLDLWKHTPNLDFITHPIKLKFPAELIQTCKYIQMVNSVIQSHKALRLKKFRIRFYINKSAQSAVAKWLEFVVSRRVENLELNFRYGRAGASYMVVLEELLRPQTLIILFKSLKRLYLKSMKVSGEDISLFLRNCPFLRELAICSSVLTSNVDVDVCAVALEVLDIRWCFGRKSIKVSAPNLTSVSVDARSGKKLLLENVPKVVEAGFRIHKRFGVQHFASAVSSFISQLQTLTLTLYHPKLLANGFSQMPNLKELVVTDRGVYENGGLVPITALIWASPRLQVFHLMFMGELKDATSHLEVITDVERSPHQHLKTFKFEGLRGGVRDHIVELVTCISNNCVALRKIIFGCPLRVPGEPEVQADRDHLKQQLRGKLPHHVRLRFFQLT